MHEVIMPKLGLTMETGVIEKWHKKEGDKVEAGEVLFEVMTDKVSLEVEAYNSGIVRKIIRAEGEEVPVTEVIAYIGPADEAIPEASAGKITTPETLEAKDTISAKIKISPLARNIAENKGIDISKIIGTGPGGRIVKEDVEAYLPKPAAVGGTEITERLKISPLAKAIAKEMGIDYLKEPIIGTGPGGRIVKEDITAFAEKLKSSAGAQRTATSATPSIAIPGAAVKIKSSTPLKGMRKLIAERMFYSSQNIPHIILTSVMDVDALVALREKIKDKVSAVYNTKITYTDFIIKACATVLAEQPNVNASLVNETQIVYEDINVGLAVAIESGLIVPTIYNADKLSVFEIAKRRAELVEKAKQGKLTMEEITNGTFTISNLGMFGVRIFTAIINPPQGAILMVGEVYKAPAFVGDRIEPKQFMEISVAVDHRIIDGANGARYLQRLKEIIENPELLLI
ncbi:MAG TPA: 2-oxo acid dehydrogenase subunit E2 [Methanosarcinales archaeon]|nr:2-oxo acid dehydrogenase subunit E2 [Methanosarcinales archaeon]